MSAPTLTRPTLVPQAIHLAKPWVVSRRIPSLDGLRALSILMVLAGHFAYSPGFPIPNSWWTNTYAHYGVRIFFVISGFLITTLLLWEKDKNGRISLKQFYIRRAYRILPVAYVYLIAVTALYYSSLSYGQLALAFTYMTSYVNHLPWVLCHLWSLSVEEQFYLVWPVVLALGLVSPRRLAWAVVAIAPAARFIFDKSGLGFASLWTFPSVADSLACGCLLALYQPELQKHRSVFAWRGFALIWGFTLAVPVLCHFVGGYAHAALVWPLSGLVDRGAIPIYNFGVALCIQNAITAPPRILNTRLAVWLGTLSYSLYIWQMPFANPGVHSWATTFPVNLGLAWLAAVVSYYAVEKPLLRLRERRAARLARKDPYPSAVRPLPASQKSLSG